MLGLNIMYRQKILKIIIKLTKEILKYNEKG